MGIIFHVFAEHEATWIKEKKRGPQKEKGSGMNGTKIRRVWDVSSVVAFCAEDRPFCAEVCSENDSFSAGAFWREARCGRDVLERDRER